MKIVGEEDESQQKEAAKQAEEMRQLQELMGNMEA